MRFATLKNGGIDGVLSNAGGILTGPLVLAGNPTQALEAAPKQYVDSAISAHGNNTAIHPTSGEKNLLSSITTSTTEINRLTGITGVVQTQLDAKLPLAGGTLTGFLSLHANPINTMHAATKQYVDSAINGTSGFATADIVRKPYTTTPSGFLKCNGAYVSKVTYSALFAVIGNTFDIEIVNIDYNNGSGQPHRQQYYSNTEQTADITGWTTGTALPGTLAFSQAIVTKNRVYLLGGYNGTANVSTVYTASINADGTIGTWTTGTSLPGVLSNSQAIVTKNRVYLLGGYNGTNWVSTVYTASINADGTLGTWTTGTALPGVMGNIQAIVTKNRVYTLGGNNGTWVGIVYTAPINADGTLGDWTTGTSLPTASGGSQAIVTKNRVYLIGGNDGINSVYTAPINTDGTLGTWAIGTSLPGLLSNSQAIVTKNRVYLLGGNNATVWTASVYTAPINSDGTLGTWTTGTALPVTLGYSQVIVTKNRVYILGGMHNGVYSSAVYQANILGGTNDYSMYYDGTINTFEYTYRAIGSGQPWREQYDINTSQSTDITGWTTVSSLPATVNYGQVIVTKNRVYALGGSDGYITTSAVYTAPINSDGSIGTWTTGTSLPGPLAWLQAIVTKNRVYLLGGNNGTTYVATVYTAPINSDGTLGTWTTGTALPGPLAQTHALVTKNRVYLLGGYDGGGSVGTVYTAPINSDGTLGTWTTGTALPAALRGSQAIVTKNRAYLIGGYGAGYLNTVYTALINADGTLGTWTTGTAFPIAGSGSQSIVTKNRVYIICMETGSYLSTVYTAPINSDGTLGTWTTGTSLPISKVYAQVIITKNKIHVLGGTGGNSIYTASISAEINDYSPYYDGTVNKFDGTDPIITTNPDLANLFAIPDASVVDATTHNSNHYIKY